MPGALEGKRIAFLVANEGIKPDHLEAFCKVLIDHFAAAGST